MIIVAAETSSDSRYPLGLEQRHAIKVVMSEPEPPSEAAAVDEPKGSEVKDAQQEESEDIADADPNGTAPVTEEEQEGEGVADNVSLVTSTSKQSSTSFLDVASQSGPDHRLELKNIKCVEYRTPPLRILTRSSTGKKLPVVSESLQKSYQYKPHHPALRLDIRHTDTSLTFTIAVPLGIQFEHLIDEVKASSRGVFYFAWS